MNPTDLLIHWSSATCRAFFRDIYRSQQNGLAQNFVHTFMRPRSLMTSLIPWLFISSHQRVDTFYTIKNVHRFQKWAKIQSESVFLSAVTTCCGKSKELKRERPKSQRRVDSESATVRQKEREKERKEIRQWGQLESSKKWLFRSVSGHPAEGCTNVMLLWPAALATPVCNNTSGHLQFQAQWPSCSEPALCV